MYTFQSMQHVGKMFNKISFSLSSFTCLLSVLYLQPHLLALALSLCILFTSLSLQISCQCSSYPLNLPLSPTTPTPLDSVSSIFLFSLFFSLSPSYPLFQYLMFLKSLVYSHISSLYLSGIFPLPLLFLTTALFFYCV